MLFNRKVLAFRLEIGPNKMENKLLMKVKQELESEEERFASSYFDPSTNGEITIVKEENDQLPWLEPRSVRKRLRELDNYEETSTCRNETSRSGKSNDLNLEPSISQIKTVTDEGCGEVASRKEKYRRRIYIEGEFNEEKTIKQKTRIENGHRHKEPQREIKETDMVQTEDTPEDEKILYVNPVTFEVKRITKREYEDKALELVFDEETEKELDQYLVPKNVWLLAYVTPKDQNQHNEFPEQRPGQRFK